MIARLACCLIVATASLAIAAEEAPAPLTVEPRLVHLRMGEAREWSDFPAEPHGAAWEVRFQAARNDREHTLRLRQQDVKQSWHVQLNGQRLGNLVIDESDLALALPIPTGGLLEGENVLRIAPASSRARAADDIRVGEVRLERRPVAELLGEATVELEVQDEGTGKPLPCRLTIVDARGALQPTSAVSNDHLAVRIGTIFTSRGRARFGLPAGEYTVYAGRGFEYSLAQVAVSLKAGETVRKTLAIRREVPTAGYAACDTHIHTLSFSGHGDATIDERMLTLAGEGIELPIATDHNVHIDYEPHAARLGVRQYFTPVMGNEVTTALGHFNIFPVLTGSRVPDHKRPGWEVTFDEIFRTPGVKVAILNHARDLHSGTRPFDPKLYNAVVGENWEGWPLRFNAMEVINSGATQTDALRLFHDWMALLNRGFRITPVGGSDSHDVKRHFVGQGRTYIRCDDRDVARLDVDAAVRNFLQGQVLVSYGLLAEMTVNGKYGCGEMAAVAGDELSLTLRVLGPHWVRAERIQLYANGQLIREEMLPAKRDPQLPPGVQWQAAWKLPRPKHDVHLVAIASGAGVSGPFWTTAKSYQPTSPDWQAHTLGCSGAIGVDADGDGVCSSARHYAERLFAAARGDLPRMVAALADYDEATAAQAAHLFHAASGSLQSAEYAAALRCETPAVQAGFRAYFAAWRENEFARARQ